MVRLSPAKFPLALPIDGNTITPTVLICFPPFISKMKIFRNICELCGHSFDSQYGFYKHLKEHYEPEFVSIGYPVQGLPVQGGGGMPEEDSEYAKEDENDGFVNDNEQFEGERESKRKLPEFPLKNPLYSPQRSLRTTSTRAPT